MLSPTKIIASEFDDGVAADPSQCAASVVISVFSGGTAFNSVVKEITRWTSRVNHILPISDNGFVYLFSFFFNIF